jgi:hypothetical protein
MKSSEVKFFILDNPEAPRPWKLTGGFHMSSPQNIVSSGYQIHAADGSQVAHTRNSGDVFWGGHREAKRLIAEGVEL